MFLTLFLLATEDIYPPVADREHREIFQTRIHPVR